MAEVICEITVAELKDSPDASLQTCVMPLLLHNGQRNMRAASMEKILCREPDNKSAPLIILIRYHPCTNH